MTPSLALGTVQFGVAYGVAGRGERVPDVEAMAILRRAWELGVRRLDTAPAYGDIEERLVSLIDDLPFSIVSKIPGLPKGRLNAEEARAHVRASVGRSRERLGSRLCGMLFHQAEDLLGPYGAVVWHEAEAASAGSLRAGPSCYNAETLDAIMGSFPIAMAQTPGNALDQGLSRARPSEALEISLRSVFLQGLLLMSFEEAAARVPSARPALERWHRFCSQTGLPPLRAALGVAKGISGAAFCLVGVDSLAQLEQIVEEWDKATPLEASWLDTDDADVIDPRRW